MSLPPPAPATTSVVIVDDDRLVRVGLSAIIDHEADLSVVGEASNGEEALRVVTATDPDVVLMDVRMPGMDGIEATRALTGRTGVDRPRVLVVTTFEHDDYVYDAITAGASGFVLKRVDPADLVDAVRIVARGESLVFPAMMRRLVEHHAPSRARKGDPRVALLATLTDREREILRAVARGESNAEIAASLVVSLHTVKTHVGNVLMKIGARDRTQAVVIAYETGFVSR
jgi:DNA-binding NarL/FixJ family response regulator